MRKRISFCMVAIFLCAAPPAFGQKVQAREGKASKLQFATIPVGVSGIDRPFWAPNRIGDFITNNGQLVSHIPRSSAGMEWPVGSHKTINYASGIWLAGKKDGEIVTAAGEYSTEFQPGNVRGWSSGVAGIPADPQDNCFKVYIINQGDEFVPWRNPDYLNWPVADGAPVDADGKPLLLGTSTAWAVFNDVNDSLHTRLFNTRPMGVEVQMTAWAFDKTNLFGDVLFFKFKFINKSGTGIDSCFVAFWADIDIGDASDLVGCDSTLSLGYNYKTQRDGQYGENPPAVGYGLLQGPIIRAPGDTASVSGRKVPNYRNLPMTAFLGGIEEGPPAFSYPENKVDVYNYMSGLDRFGHSFIDPTTNTVTTFRYSGDPVTGTGWLDIAHNDKRFWMSSGPFTLADGDTQEVVSAIIVAQGKSALESVKWLKQDAAIVRHAYTTSAIVPPNPSVPTMRVASDTASILLTWNNAAEAYLQADQFDRDENNNQTAYTFQGYNVYQLDAPVVLPESKIVRLATFDRIDGVTEIRDDVLEVETGEIVNRIVQHGSDDGVSHFLRVTTDAVRGYEPLRPNRQYYFAVTAYAYNPYGDPKTLESPLEIITIRPQSPPPGSQWTTPFGDTLAVSHTGSSEGAAYPIVVDPAALSGHDYQVTFRTGTNGSTTWDVTDLTAQETKLTGWQNQSKNDPENFPIVDGVLVKVFGSDEIIKTWNFSPSIRWFTGVNWGGAQFFGALDIGRKFFGSNITPDQYVTVEIRFLKTASGQRAYGFVGTDSTDFTFASYAPQHFTAWDVTASPSRQINVAFVERTGSENSLWDPSTDSNDLNYLLILYSSYSGDTTDPNYTTKTLRADADDFDTLYFLWPRLRGSNVVPGWDDGQVFTIVPYFVNSSKDIFTYKTIAPIRNDLALAKRQTAQWVNVYPNPYRGFNIEERSAAERFVTFTHLPETAKIQIFTLSGTPVCTLIHNNGTQYERWDLRNSRNIPVASGIYLVHIDMGAIGAKVLKLIVFQPAEVSDND